MPSRLEIAVALLNEASGEANRITADIQKLGGATDTLSALENRLAQAMFASEEATRKLDQATTELNANTDPERQRELEGAVLDARVQLDQANTTVGQYTQSISEAYAPTQMFTEANQSGTISLTELNSALGIGRQALQLTEQAYTATIGKTLQYGDEVRNLARTIGATPEEASRLIQAADDVGISADSLSTALEAAIRKGVRPTIQGIGELADQYNKIQDPIERTRFLQENFGRSGADLAALMEKGAAGIAEAGHQADLAGQVMSGPALQAQRDLEIAVDDLHDSVDGMTYSLSEHAIPTITAWINRMNDGIAESRDMQTAIEQTGVDSYDAHRLMIMGIQANTDAQTALKTQLNDTTTATQANTGSTSAWADVLDRAADRGETLISTEDRLEAANNRDKKSADEAAQSVKNFQTAMGDLNTLIAGAVGNENQQYQDSQDALIKKQQDLGAELEKYMGLQGQAIPPADDLTERQHAATLASDQYNQALANLAAAQGAAVTNTQYHYAAQEIFTQKVDAAQVALDKAKDALDKANQSVTNGSGGVGDYSKKIEELKKQYTEASAAVEANAQEHELATKRIIFGMLEQQAQSAITSGQLSGPDAQRVQEALTQTALKMGLIDQATANAQTAVHTAFGDLMKGDMEGYNQALDEAVAPMTTDIPEAAHSMETTMGMTFGGVTTTAKTTTDTGIKPLADAVKTDMGPAFHAVATGPIPEFGTVLLKQTENGGVIPTYVIGLDMIDDRLKNIAKDAKAVPPLSGGGGGGTDMTGLHGMANGGIASGPDTGYPMMLHGDEAVVPLPGNRSIPVQFTGNGGGGGKVVHIQIGNVNASSPAEFFDLLEGEAQARGLGSLFGDN